MACYCCAQMTSRMGACKMLSEVRQLRQVEFVKADERLFSMMGSRVDGVFIKLHAIGLIECSQAALQWH